uniref:Uncharacterized protein n=1 Tax=viral metagenome TaxID=1070528 RepID=A0A6C0EDM8_9ZZZZ
MGNSQYNAIPRNDSVSSMSTGISLEELQRNVTTSSLVMDTCKTDNEEKLIEPDDYPKLHELSSFLQSNKGRDFVIYSKDRTLKDAKFVLHNVDSVIANLDDINFITYVGLCGNVTQINDIEYTCSSYSVVKQWDFPDEYFRNIEAVEKKQIYEKMIKTQNKHLAFLYTVVCNDNGKYHMYLENKKMPKMKNIILNITENTTNKKVPVNVYSNASISTIKLKTKYDIVTCCSSKDFHKTISPETATGDCKVAYIKLMTPDYKYLLVDNNGEVNMQVKNGNSNFMLYNSSQFAHLINFRINPFAYLALYDSKKNTTAELDESVVRHFNFYCYVNKNNRTAIITKMYINNCKQTIYNVSDMQLVHANTNFKNYSYCLNLNDIPNTILELPDIYDLLNSKIKFADFWKLYLHPSFKYEWMTYDNITYVISKATEYILKLSKDKAFEFTFEDLSKALKFGENASKFTYQLFSLTIKHLERIVPMGFTYTVGGDIYSSGVMLNDEIKNIYVKNNKLHEWYYYILSANRDGIASYADIDKNILIEGLKLYPKFLFDLTTNANIYSKERFDKWLQSNNYIFPKKYIKNIMEQYKNIGGMMHICQSMEQMIQKKYITAEDLVKLNKKAFAYIKPIYRTDKLSSMACRHKTKYMQYVVLDDEQFYINELNNNPKVFPYIRRKTDKIIEHALTLDKNNLKYVAKPTIEMRRIAEDF